MAPGIAEGCFGCLECSLSLLQSCETILGARASRACPSARALLASASVKSFSSEAGPYVLGTALTGVLFIAGMIRLWLLRRVEIRLLKNKEDLEKQVVQQQKDLLQARSDANAWRAEMQRQFDHFRAMASDQLKVEENRFDNLLNKSREREKELLTTLDITRQICAELPAAKARVMQLESLLGIDDGEGLTTAPPTKAAAPVTTFRVAPLPDLNGSLEASNGSDALPPPSPAAPPEVLQSEVTDASGHELEELRRQNTLLQQALTAERLRSRLRERSSSGVRGRFGRRNGAS